MEIAATPAASDDEKCDQKAEKEAEIITTFQYVPVEDIMELFRQSNKFVRDENLMIIERTKVEAKYAADLEAWAAEYDRAMKEAFDAEYIMKTVKEMVDCTRQTAEMRRNLVEKMAGDADGEATSEELGTFNELFPQTKVVMDFANYAKQHPQRELDDLLSHYQDSMKTANLILKSADKRISDKPKTVDTKVSHKVVYKENSRKESPEKKEKKHLFGKWKSYIIEQPHSTNPLYGQHFPDLPPLPGFEEYLVEFNEKLQLETDESQEKGFESSTDPDNPGASTEDTSTGVPSSDLIRWKVYRNYAKHQLSQEMSTVNAIMETIAEWEVQRVQTCKNALSSASKLLLDFGVSTDESHDAVEVELSRVEPDECLREWITEHLRTFGQKVNLQTLKHLDLRPSDVTDMNKLKKHVWRRLFSNKHTQNKQEESEAHAGTASESQPGSSGRLCTRMRNIILENINKSAVNEDESKSIHETQGEGSDVKQEHDVVESFSDDFITKFFTSDDNNSWATECITILNSVASADCSES